jgi:hypothetical protein
MYLGGKMCSAKWEIQFRRMLSPEAMKEWEEMQELLRGVILSLERDCVKWGLTKKEFTIDSLCKFITHGGVNCKMARKILKCKILLKIRIFLW